MFPSSSNNTDRALRFLGWVQESKDNYYLMIFGIKGKDYVIENGIPATPGGKSDKERSFMRWDGYWSMLNIEHHPDNKRYTGQGVNNRKDFMGKYTLYPPHTSFYPDYNMIRGAVNERSNAIYEFEYALSHGMVLDTTQVEAYIKKLEALGSDRLIEEANRQIK